VAVSKTSKKRKQASSKPSPLLKYLYENGISIREDPKRFNFLLGAWKRLFSRSPERKSVLLATRITKPRYNKDGTRAKKDQVFYTCKSCGDLIKSTEVQVDHIEPVIPVDKAAIDLTWEEIETRLFCDKSNLQVLCKKCHKEKSNMENKTRRENKKKRCR
jgi:5-methylcytosine-specific restriction endonuclease McrA